MQVKELPLFSENAPEISARTGPSRDVWITIIFFWSFVVEPACFSARKMRVTFVVF